MSDREELIQLLEQCLELAAECISYTDNYFRDKWCMEDEYEEIKTALEMLKAREGKDDNTKAARADKAEAEGQFNEAVKTIDLLTESLNDKGLRLMKAVAERDELIIILFDMIKWGIINEN